MGRDSLRVVGTRGFYIAGFVQGLLVMILLAAAIAIAGTMNALDANSNGGGVPYDRAGEVEAESSANSIPELLRCGPIALQLCSKLCGRSLRADAIDKYFKPGTDENTLAEVRDAAHAVGLSTRAVKWRVGLPPSSAPPAVIPIVNSRGKRHFVAIAGCRNGLALIVDVPQQPAWMSEEALRTKLHWQGEALHIASSDAELAALRSELVFGGRTFSTAPWLAAAGVTLVMCLVGWELRLRRRRSIPVQVGE